MPIVIKNDYVCVVNQNNLQKMGHTLTTAPQALPPLTKRHQLDRLLKITQIYKWQMRSLFTKNNIAYYDMGQLPEEDKKSWYELFKKEHRVFLITTLLLLSK